MGILCTSMDLYIIFTFYLIDQDELICKVSSSVKGYSEGSRNEGYLTLLFPLVCLNPDKERPHLRAKGEFGLYSFYILILCTGISVTYKVSFCEMDRGPEGIGSN